MKTLILIATLTLTGITFAGTVCIVDLVGSYKCIETDEDNNIIKTWGLDLEPSKGII
tara:strand:+ start:955 stop:1125 length:171 start_codon:yes stop_codon:yes gene_type:complete